MSDCINQKISFVEKFEFEFLCSKIAIDNQLSEIEEPFYVCNLGDVVWKHQLWLSSFPRITPFYAVKCNPTPVILKLMANMGLSFDCASRAEIKSILDEGVPSSRIIYANPCKQTSHIKFAASAGVDLMTCDTVSEVVKIKQAYPSASAVIRMFVETSKARCPLGLKFGASAEEIEKILKKTREINLNVVGVSFHVGSGCFDASVYGEAIRKSRCVFDLAHTYGYSFRILDIGGGFPGELHKESNFELFRQVRDVINDSLELFFPVEEFGDTLEVIAEPGRFYVSSAFHLCCTVTSTKGSELLSQSDSDYQESPSFNYYLNDGVYGSFNCVIFDHYVPDSYLFSARDSGNNVFYRSTLWGPTCDSMDKICERMLPKLETDDHIMFSDMGAYTMAAGCTFNGFPRPLVHYFVDRERARFLSTVLGVSLCDDSIESENCSWTPPGVDSDQFLSENIMSEMLDDIYSDADSSNVLGLGQDMSCALIQFTECS